MGQTITLQPAYHPTRILRRRDEEVWIEEGDFSDYTRAADSCFDVVPGLTGGALSFRLHDDSSRYLRHRGGFCFVEENDESQVFKDDSTFVLLPGGLASSGVLAPPCVAFEAVNLPGFYLAHTDFRVQMLRFTDTEEFKQNISWTTTKSS